MLFLCSHIVATCLPHLESMCFAPDLLPNPQWVEIPESKPTGISHQPPDGRGQQTTDNGGCAWHEADCCVILGGDPGLSDVLGAVRQDLYKVCLLTHTALPSPLRDHLAGPASLPAWDPGTPASWLRLPPFWNTSQVPLGANGRKPNFLLQEMARLVKNIFKD